ncbi:riboflavin biosynthesis protein RibF [Aerococcus sanguinicola]|uniref:riboflavin biosynthesis protein RibF n=1 Tax=unclassified Aerococcus TaxID=2618060 RepID=UPI0008A2A22F|nr:MULTISPECIES: riboflavin biosynthesis protein RibF [unclassified Aerococcus]MDK6232702.1 riboflavin biosynthesis protein RibF [Aerococcus sp. UMB10185]MDK6805349.1 riboflavin biosynthesis protein RibF [Aerococcus sp. UMB7834]MDK6855008.1 riboflavin biosynthesis protein RibF [Aerococcus sp. UMB7533]MDK8501726.1 riboflavin biosynthesis protein RibF [Aerococcus sp. UMB1112A]OFN02765.1 bifunctional riboflavin kinase/FMN adenylyltransferase [Aerococcus sp. HMSC062A02]
MQTIKLHHPFSNDQVLKGPIVLALGFFDGVHRGHQRVLAAARREASKRRLPLVAMTFDMAPSIMYQELKPTEVKYLTTVEAKERLMAHHGVDYLYLVQYTSQFAYQTPQEFVDHYMAGLNAAVVVAGFDYTYGKKDIANMQTLPDYAKGRFEILEVPELAFQNKKIGSRRIKALLEEGQLGAANQALGHPYFFKGTVIHGEKRGRTLGYPTANLSFSEEVLVPAVGVYAVECELNHHLYRGMASIGYNVTFGDNREQTVEINLLDFEEEIYGETMTVFWHAYLRPELKFDSAEALVDQLHQDALDTQAYFDQEGLEEMNEG